MTDGFFDQDDRAAFRAVATAEDCRITALVAAADLDPASDLRGLPLRSVVFQPEENLSGYDLTGADLTGAILRRLDLTGVDLSKACLDGADLRGTTLREGQLSPEQQAAAKTGPLPPALRYGQNISWPPELDEEIEGLLADVEELDDLIGKFEVELRLESYDLLQVLAYIGMYWAMTLSLSASDNKPITSALACVFILQFVGDVKTAIHYLREIYDRFVPAPDEELQETTLWVELWFLTDLLGADGAAKNRMGKLLAEVPRLFDLMKELSWAAHLVGRALFEFGDFEIAAKLIQESQQGKDDKGLPGSHSLRLIVLAGLADASGHADEAEQHLKQAEDILADYSPENIFRRYLNRYLDTRVPGQPGGTTVPDWSETDEDVEEDESEAPEPPKAQPRMMA